MIRCVLNRDLPLYGQELSQDISPLEAGLGFVVKLNKEEDFIGKEALAHKKKTVFHENLSDLK